MAHKKGEGSSRNGRESHSQRLGVKLFGGQLAIPGNIIVRQRGTRFYPGDGVMMGKDHTIFAVEKGIIEFRKRRGERNYISVIPPEQKDNAVPPEIKESANPAEIKDADVEALDE